MIGALLHQLRRFSGPARLDVVRLEGAARATGAGLCVAYIGNGANLQFVQELLFATSSSQLIDTLANALHVRARARRLTQSVDLLITDLTPLWDRLARSERDLRVDAWVSQTLDLPQTPGPNGRILPREIEREAARHVRRQQYAVEFTDDEAARREFYRSLYVPYVRARFGERALQMDEAYFMARSAGHTLARLTAAGQPAASMTVDFKRGALHMGWYAAAANPPLRGASEVLDVLCIQHAYETGVRRIVMGQSRPTLNDGVVRYKARFGTRIAAMKFPQPVLGISICRYSPALAASLNEPEFVAIVNDRAMIYRFDLSALRPKIVLEPAVL